ncbi:ATP-binding cassette domain-containing protein [Streptomyces cirratus]
MYACGESPAARRVEAVADVDLEIAAGERVALTGTNGSGKTTLLRAVLGPAPPGGGLDPGRWTGHPHARRNGPGGAGPVPGSPRSPPPAVSHCWARIVVASSAAPDDASEAADRLGVGQLTARPLHTLSGGQLQRMYLARAIGCVAAGAEVLLADEPTAALDFDGQAEAADVLTSLPVTLVVVTHDRALADRCDRVLEMAAGRLREVR